MSGVCVCVCAQPKPEETWCTPMFAVAIWSNIKTDQIASPRPQGSAARVRVGVSAHTVGSVGSRIRQSSDKHWIEKWHNEFDCDSSHRSGGGGWCLDSATTLSSAFRLLTLTTSIMKLPWLLEVTWHPRLMAALNIPHDTPTRSGFMKADVRVKKTLFPIRREGDKQG